MALRRTSGTHAYLADCLLLPHSGYASLLRPPGRNPCQLGVPNHPGSEGERIRRRRPPRNPRLPDTVRVAAELHPCLVEARTLCRGGPHRLRPRARLVSHRSVLGGVPQAPVDMSDARLPGQLPDAVPPTTPEPGVLHDGWRRDGAS